MNAKDILGCFLIFVGIVLLYIGITMDTSVKILYPEITKSFNLNLPERVNNIGLMQEKQNYLMFGGICFVLGLILIYAFHNSRKQMEYVETKKCPDCAETIQQDARICRYCSFSFNN